MKNMFKKLCLVCSVTMIVFTCCGCGETETKKQDSIVDTLVGSESASSTLEAEENVETNNDDIHDGYKVAKNEDEWYSNGCSATEVICPIFQITKEEANELSTLEYIMFFADKMKLITIEGTNTEYSYEDARFENADEAFFAEILKDKNNETDKLEAEFKYGEDNESIKITVQVFFENDLIEKRWVNALVSSESGFFLRDNEKKIDHYPEVFANTILSKDDMAESIPD